MSCKKIVVIGLKGLPAYGGAAAVGENVINQLKGDFQFTVLCTASHTNRNSGYYDNVRIIVYKKFGNSGINTLIYYIKCLIHTMMNKYDTVHLHHAESGFITPFLRLKSYVVVTFHGIFNKNDPKFGVLANYFFKISQYLNLVFADSIVSVSKPDAIYLKKRFNSSIIYIPNGCSAYLPSKTNKDNAEEYIAFSAGRIYSIKGLHVLIDALKLLSINSIIPKLIVVGDLDQVGEYNSMITKTSKNLNIEFLGLIKDKTILMELIKGAKIYIFPSLTEAMSMMLLETVSTKTPVIASNIPANRSIFSDKEMLFFKSNSKIDLAAKIEYALTHEKEMEVKAENAYNKLNTYYTWEEISKKYMSIYNRSYK